MYVSIYCFVFLPLVNQENKTIQNLAIFNAKICKELKFLEYSVSTLKEEVTSPTGMFLQNRKKLG